MGHEGTRILKDQCSVRNRHWTESHGTVNIRYQDCLKEGKPTPTNKRDKVSTDTSLTDIRDKARFQQKTPTQRNIAKMGYIWATPALKRA